MKIGCVYKQRGDDEGWTICRISNDEDRVMLPASSFQTWDEVDASVADGKKWVDPHPPALPEVPEGVVLEWLDAAEAGEYHGHPIRLFKPPPGSDVMLDPNDIKQGALGDCWFMAAASTVAMFKGGKVRHRWQGRYDENKGIYEFKFYNEVDFAEHRVLVDGRLPLRKLTPLKPGYRRGDGLPGDYRIYLCSSGTPGEVWPSLLEKALAKLYGGYDNIVGGSNAVGIANLMRGVPLMFGYLNADGSPLPKSPDKLWSKLVRLWNQGYLLGIGWVACPNAGAGGPCGEPAGPYGLISGHSYSILGLHASESTGLRFVKIRNPHAANEWQGPWSDNSEELRAHPQVRAEVALADDEAGEDGVFIMEIGDVVRYGDGLEGVDCFNRDNRPKEFARVDARSSVWQQQALDDNEDP
jgi:hypothetical protein